MSQRVLHLTAIFFGVLFAPVLAHAEDGGSNFSITAGYEQFHEEEFMSKVKLLDEDGPRATIGIGWSRPVDPSGGAVYRASARLYGGNVDYQGQACNLSGTCVPLDTKTGYWGLQMEGLGGYRFGGTVGTEIFSGIGADIWQRKLQGAYSSLGYVQGATEQYLNLYAKLGASAFMRFNGWGMTLRAGPKLPLYVSETSDDGLFDKVTLHPKPRISPFASLEFAIGQRPRDTFTITLYYDSNKFAESKPVSLKIGGAPTGYAAVQPDTNTHAYGVQFGYTF